MGFNLPVHILDHSKKIHNTLGSNPKWEFDENDKRNQHFTLSIDISQLIINHGCFTQKDVDEKMTAFMDDLIQYEDGYKEKNGKYKGTQKYRTRKFAVNGDSLLAYHNSASDTSNSQNYTVTPHFHFLADRRKSLGWGYSYFRVAINQVSKKHNLVFNLEEETDAPKVNSKKASDLTWFIKRSSDEHFINQIKNGWIEEALLAFQEHYKRTGNLQYLLKGYRDLDMRSKRLNIKHNLNFNLFLTQQQKDTVETLCRGDKKKIYELLSDRSNHIARGYLEHCYGFNNIIIDEIQKCANKIIPIIDLDLNRINVKIKHKEKSLGDYTKTVNYCYKEDLTQALNYSKKEKELAQLMKELGYQDFAYKQKNILGKRQRVGFTFQNKNSKTITVYFNNIKTDMKSIRAKLIENSKNNIVIPNELKSHLKAYVPAPRISFAAKMFEEIYDLNSSLNLDNFYVKEIDNHVEFRAKGTFIVDEGSSILVKAQKTIDLERNVALLADMIESKGWRDFEIHSANSEFKLALKAEVARRANNKLSKQKVLENKTSSESKIIKSVHQPDEEILKILKDLNLSRKDINLDDYEQEFMQLYKIRAKAIRKGDVSKLLKTYDVDQAQEQFEIRQKIIDISQCLNIKTIDIIELIAEDTGLRKEDIDVFQKHIKSMDTYDIDYLSNLIELINDRLADELLLDPLISNNELERNIRTLEKIALENDNFRAQYISRKEYIKRVEDTRAALKANLFYEVQQVINSLDNFDRKALEYEYSEKIDLAAEKMNFEQLKVSVDTEMKNIYNFENELI